MTVAELREALAAYPDDIEVKAMSLCTSGKFPITTVEAIGADKYYLLLSDI